MTPLKVGDTFPTKERMMLKIVEEANLYGVHVAIKRSDTFQVGARGLNGGSFHVHGNFGIKTGWKVTVCVVGIDSISRPTTPNDTAAEKRTSIAGNNNFDNLLGEIQVIGGQDGNPDNTNGDVTDEDGNGDMKHPKTKRQKSPVKSNFFVLLMKATITEWSNISNKEMATILRPYINDIFITNALLQKTCSDVRALVFGDPNKNIQLF